MNYQLFVRPEVEADIAEAQTLINVFTIQ